MGILLFTLGGCGRQKILAPPKVTHKIPLIRVALEDNLSMETLFFQDPFRLISEEATYILNSDMGHFTVRFENGTLTIKSKERSFSFHNFETIKVVPENEGVFLWNNISYTGRLNFTFSNHSVQVINILPLPQYLEGVVPYEIPSHSEEYYQAVIAQTIAARTYAIYRMKNPESQYFDLYSDIRDQVYQGTHIKAILVEKAIKESFGTIIQTPQNEVVRIQYHSTCGGTLDLSSPEVDSKNTVIKDHSELNDYCIVSPLYRWVSKLTIRDILDNLVNSGLVQPSEAEVWKEEGFDLNLEVQSRKPSGRIDKLAIKVKNRSFVLKEWQIRRVFSNKTGQPQPSTLFFLKHSPSEPSLVYIIGAGFGHGRGMCQWGAIGKALDGDSYIDILNFYYPDLILNNLY